MLMLPLLLIRILRRALADSLDHLGVLAFRHFIVDGNDVDLVPPVVAKVKPVAERLIHLQPQRVDRGLGYVASDVLRPTRPSKAPGNTYRLPLGSFGPLPNWNSYMCCSQRSNASKMA